MTSADSWSDLSEKDMWARKDHKSSKAVLSQDWCHASGGVRPKHKHGRLSQLSRLFPWRWFFLFAFLGFQSIGKTSCNMASDGWSQGFLIFGLNGDISDPRGTFIWETLDLSGKNFSMIAVSRWLLYPGNTWTGLDLSVSNMASALAEKSRNSAAHKCILLPGHSLSCRHFCR